MESTYQSTMLLGVKKIQILKVIHNTVVSRFYERNVVGNHKDTNFESNSQLSYSSILDKGGCWKSQRYKF